MRAVKIIFIVLGGIFLVFSIICSAAFFLLKRVDFKAIIEKEIKTELGVNVSIQKLNISPLFTRVSAINIYVDNPAGFEEKELAYISQLHLLWDPVEAIIRKKPNIYACAIDLKRLNVVKNKEGLVNLNELPIIKNPKPDQQPFFFYLLLISVGELNYTQYNHKGQKATRNYPVHIYREAFYNVKDEDDVAKMVIYKAIGTTEVGKLANITIVPVVSDVSDTVSSAWVTVRSGAKSAAEIVAIPFKLIFGWK